MAQIRPLGFWETVQKTFFDSYGCSGMILQIMRIEGAVESGIVAQALAHLLQRHPLLRARFGEVDGQAAFHVPDADEPRGPAPLRVLPFAGIEQVHRLAAAEARMPFAGEYLWRALLFQADTHSDIVFLIHHSIADGHSLVQLTHELMTLCSLLAGGDEPSWPELPLLPPTEQMLSRDLPASAGEQAQAGQKNEPVHMAYESWAPLEQRGLGLCLRELPLEESGRLVAQCRTYGVTVNGAVLAALLQAHQTEAAGQSSCLQMDVALSLRRFCKPEPKPKNLGCHIMMLQLQARPAHGFWETAKACQQELGLAINQRQRQGFLPRTFHPAFIRSALRNNIDRANAQRRFAAGICYSNPGVLRLEPRYGPYRISDIHFFGCETAGLWKFFLLTQSLHGRIIFDFIFTEPLVSRKTVELLADGMIDILKRQAQH